MSEIFAGHGRGEYEDAPDSHIELIENVHLNKLNFMHLAILYTNRSDQQSASIIGNP